MEFLFTNQIASIEALLIFLCLSIIIGICLVDFYVWIIRVIGVLTPRKEYIQETKKSEEDTALIEGVSEKNEVIEEYLASKKTEENPLPEINKDYSETKEANGVDESSPYIDLINELPSESPSVIPNENILELANIEDISTFDKVLPTDKQISIKDEVQMNQEGSTEKEDVHIHENGKANFLLSDGNDIEEIALVRAKEDIKIDSTNLNENKIEEEVSGKTIESTIEIPSPLDIQEVSHSEELLDTISKDTLQKNITGDVSEAVLSQSHESFILDESHSLKLSRTEDAILTGIIPNETFNEPTGDQVDLKDITLDLKDESTSKNNSTDDLVNPVPLVKKEDENNEISIIQEDESFIGKEIGHHDTPLIGINTLNLDESNTPQTPTYSPQTQITISPEKKEKLVEIINTARTLVARGHFIEARGMIINGLSFHKDNKELNILLAELYERDRDYQKAEYIFKDMAHLHPNDGEILTHLASNLAIQRKYDVSYELYKKVLSISGGTEDILFTLTHLASELNLSEDAYAYARAYLHQYPKSPEILWLMAQAQIAMNERKFAIETLIKLKNLTPYNQEIVDLIQKLVMEQELAGNFGEKNSHS